MAEYDRPRAHGWVAIRLTCASLAADPEFKPNYYEGRCLSDMQVSFWLPTPNLNPITLRGCASYVRNSGEPRGVMRHWLLSGKSCSNGFKDVPADILQLLSTRHGRPYSRLWREYEVSCLSGHAVNAKGRRSLGLQER